MVEVESSLILGVEDIEAFIESFSVLVEIVELLET